MKSKTSATMLLVLTFVLGGVTGGVSFYIYHDRTSASEPRGGRRGGSRDIIEDMARDLSLDSVQKEKLRAVFRESRDRYRALSEHFRPQYEMIRQETDRQIAQVLTEDQKALFDKRFKPPRGRDKKSGPHPPPPHP